MQPVPSNSGFGISCTLRINYQLLLLISTIFATPSNTFDCMRVSKKVIVIAIAVGLLLLIVLPFIVIPSNLTVVNYDKVKCIPTAFARTMNTNKFLAAFINHTDSSFTLNGYTYRVSKTLYNSSDIEIKHGEDVYETSFVLIGLAQDSSMVNWVVNDKKEAGNNPIGRIVNYRKAVALKENMEAVLRNLKPFIENSTNVYGFNISHTTLTDTDLVAIKKSFKTYPDTKEIYAMVDEVKSYATMHGAQINSYPMLNVSLIDSVYETMVAIPVNKVLPALGAIVPKHLVPIRDKIITTEIHGGTATVKEAYRQVELYMTEHSLSAPVIPFEQLITDRSKETDTTKWVTRIFYPIV